MNRLVDYHQSSCKNEMNMDYSLKSYSKPWPCFQGKGRQSIHSLLQSKKLRTHYDRQLTASSNKEKSEWIDAWNESKINFYLCLIKKRFVLTWRLAGAERKRAILDIGAKNSLWQASAMKKKSYCRYFGRLWGISCSMQSVPILQECKNMLRS
jgi:hypothetical protein